jgi:two-component system response regulator RegA
MRAGEEPVRTIVVVNTDTGFLRLCLETFCRFGWNVHTATEPNEIDIERIKASVFVIDVCPRRITSLQFLEATRKVHPLARLFATTSNPSSHLTFEVVRAGAECCFGEPVEPTKLLRALVQGDVGGSPETSPLPSLGRLEWDYISRVLDIADGNISRTARLLGIQRSTLQRKLKKHPPVW